MHLGLFPVDKDVCARPGHCSRIHGATLPLHPDIRFTALRGGGDVGGVRVPDGAFLSGVPGGGRDIKFIHLGMLSPSGDLTTKPPSHGKGRGRFLAMLGFDACN